MSKEDITIKEFKEIQEYIEGIKSLTNTSGYTNTERNLGKDIENKAIALFDELKVLIKTAKQLKELKYKVGEIVFHQKHGPCFVVAINLPDLLRTNNNSFSFNNEIDLQNVGYIIMSVGVTGSGSSIIHKHFVKEDELIPYTDATKVLFNGKP